MYKLPCHLKLKKIYDLPGVTRAIGFPAELLPREMDGGGAEGREGGVVDGNEGGVPNDLSGVRSL